MACFVRHKHSTPLLIEMIQFRPLLYNQDMHISRRITTWLGWNRTSAALMSGFLLLVLLILYIWWPLAEEYLRSYDPRYPFWLQVDWLLLGIFAVMSLLITSRPDLRHDLPILLVGAAGGLVIETWGTQSGLWAYFTGERPPLWILPAWPIASLAIDRLDRTLQNWLGPGGTSPTPLLRGIYGLVFGAFVLLMLPFVWPTRTSPLTLAAVGLCLLLVLTPPNLRRALLTFAAGSSLGYFLERWGTTRECWVYWTHQTPPLFAVLAHGMAAVAFARSQAVLGLMLKKLVLPLLKRLNRQQPGWEQQRSGR